MKSEVERRGYTFFTRNQEELDRIISDVFDGGEYSFESNSERPYIIDCGAHVGVSLAYFHSLNPKSELLAFEPNPESFELLERMVLKNGINARLINAAVAGGEGQVEFYVSRADESPWSWGDSLVKNRWYDPETTTSISVQSVSLVSYLDRPVDLLKLDVEGMETEIIRDIAPKLSMVERIILEFHGSTSNSGNRLEDIIDVLSEAGFSCRLRQFGQVVELDKVVRDDPYWVVLYGDRRSR